MNKFHEDILAGIPAVLPEPKPYDTTVSHAPKRKEILSEENFGFDDDIGNGTSRKESAQVSFYHRIRQ